MALSVLVGAVSTTDYCDITRSCVYPGKLNVEN